MQLNRIERSGKKDMVTTVTYRNGNKWDAVKNGSVVDALQGCANRLVDI